MGKTGKWLRIFLTGKKDKDREKSKERCTSHDTLSILTDNPSTPIPNLPTHTREKRRWSFRRSSATAPAAKDSSAAEATSATPPAVLALLEPENEQKKHALAVAAATAAAADAAVAAAQAAVAMIRLTTSNTGRGNTIEEAAAIRIQSFFRSHLARKALCALKGLVKLQALVRGHLVRKQATATLRCMQALVTAQARALAQRIQMAEEIKPVNDTPSLHRKSPQENRFRHTYNTMDRGMEENIKIVEMDFGELRGSTKSRSSFSNHPQPEAEHRLSFNQAAGNRAYSKQDEYQVSPAPSALTDMSPKACSGHFEDYSYNTAQSSPHYYSAMSKPDPTKLPFSFPRPDYAESLSYEYPYYPNYMANTESSKAKARSQSAPKQRPELYEKQPSRRRVSMEGRNIPRAVRMQRSSSHVGATAQNYHYPWSIKLDRSMVSGIDSECGSTSTVLTNNNYCRSLVAFDTNGNKC